MNIHQRNLKILATEICKVKNDLAPDIMNNICVYVCISLFNVDDKKVNNTNKSRLTKVNTTKQNSK